MEGENLLMPGIRLFEPEFGRTDPVISFASRPDEKRVARLSDVLEEKQIVLDLQARNRWEAIDELINNLVEAGRIESRGREEIAAVVKKRESSMSTGIGFGVGIPHGKTDLIPEALCAVGRSRRSIDFNALDGLPVNLVVLLLIPAGQFQQHLHTLAHLTKLLHQRAIRWALQQAPNAATMLRIIKDESAGPIFSSKSFNVSSLKAR